MNFRATADLKNSIVVSSILRGAVIVIVTMIVNSAYSGTFLRRHRCHGHGPFLNLCPVAIVIVGNDRNSSSSIRPFGLVQQVAVV